MSQRPLTATDSGWGLQCQDCKPHGGGIQGKANKNTQTTTRPGLEERCYMHRQYLQEGKTQERKTYSTRSRQPKPGTGQAWAAQPGRPGQEHTRLPVTAGRVTMTNGGETDHGELSPYQRSLHMSGNRMRQHIWEGVCMLNNNRYQHISIDIHTQMGGGTFIHIVIGEEVGQIDMSCLTARSDTTSTAHKGAH